MFFGPEEEEDARFVQLVDCGHIIHAESMDYWVEQNDDKGQIALPECPQCKTPVRRTGRYHSKAVVQAQNLEKVKEKMRGEVRNELIDLYHLVCILLLGF